MNETLSTLCQAYLDGGTGSVVLYYSFDSGSVSSVGSAGNFTGVFLNQSPSFSVGQFDGIVIDGTGVSALAAESLCKQNIEDDSFNLSFSNIQYGPFSGISFLRPEDLESEYSYLFSFNRFKNENGVLFGSLIKNEFDNGIVDFSYGQGFNIGVNDRNKLFFQGIDSEVGEYVLVAENIELGSDNICSARISPYEVLFANYNLLDDEFAQESLRTDCKIQNLSYNDSLYIGGSPTYLKSGKTFSGFIDNLLVISGNNAPSDLKAISSGLIATGISSSGQSYSDETITGFNISLIAPIGITGYEPVVTGYSQYVVSTDLAQFVLVKSVTPFSVDDGIRFITGYTLPNNSGQYVEGTSFLFKTDNYETTGDSAFSTLGLSASGELVDTYTVERIEKVYTTGELPLYSLSPITGFLLSAPTGYLKTFLSTSFFRTGDIISNLDIMNKYKERYKKDYLYYLDRRV